uniref:Uncharacterized protein n=1 Tax=Cannabis sativa TaxID=3483 RepID=A0A803QNM1_CANSA
MCSIHPGRSVVIVPSIIMSYLGSAPINRMASGTILIEVGLRFPTVRPTSILPRWDIFPPSFISRQVLELVSPAVCPFRQDLFIIRLMKRRPYQEALGLALWHLLAWLAQNYPLVYMGIVGTRLPNSRPGFSSVYLRVALIKGTLVNFWSKPANGFAFGGWAILVGLSIVDGTRTLGSTAIESWGSMETFLLVRTMVIIKRREMRSS